MEKEYKVEMFYPLKDGDVINFVAIHPTRWAGLREKYKFDEKDGQFDLVGFRVL